ncbi:acyl carrier protein [Streptomyces tubbatahanensis]|uniref:Acyl carrier protein n=1 Tax=Streptomyces tubbatahanensis TaxID=2923272 RepID=A0ABY3XXP1_9ACTN|nr:acyl carrier protein [Streptomyces tubbatahanensis]UNS99111.1 acyl carrier protein [Streptomyces tubbatahanensis]
MITVDTVCALIAKKLGSKAADLTLGADTAFDSVGLSSLQIADIVYTIEDDAEVELDPSQAANVKTVGDLVELVETTRAAGAAA